MDFRISSSQSERNFPKYAPGRPSSHLRQNCISIQFASPLSSSLKAMLGGGSGSGEVWEANIIEMQAVGRGRHQAFPVSTSALQEGVVHSPLPSVVRLREYIKQHRGGSVSPGPWASGPADGMLRDKVDRAGSGRFWNPLGVDLGHLVGYLLVSGFYSNI